MNIRLFIGSELADFNEVFNVMFSIGDIRDVGYGNNNKTYTLNLPLTKTNKRLLSFINQTDVKSEVDKTGRLYLGELLIIQGKVIITDYSDYAAKVIINSDDWIDDLKDKKLSELDLSAYDHLLTHDNVKNSWSASYPFVCYPMINFGALISAPPRGDTYALWSPLDFIPMFSVPQLIAKILSPYIIDSSWIASSYIKDLFILANEKIAEDSFISNKNLSVNARSDADNDATVTIPLLGTDTAFFSSYKAILPGVTTDDAAAWDGTKTTYTIPETGTYRFAGTIRMRNNAASLGLTIIDETLNINLQQKRGASVTTLATYTAGAYSGTELIENISHTLDSGNADFQAGDEFYIEINCVVSCHNATGLSQDLSIGLKAVSNLINVWSNINRYSGLNKTISAEELLPDITQIDFLVAIRDIFNLRFWIDKSKQTIHIEPWDQFLSETVIDLTEFVDFESIETELISKYYNKTTTLKWKDDDDEAYKEYLKTNPSPGQYDLILNSLFAIKDKLIKEHSFSSIINGVDIAFGEYTIDIPRIWNKVMTQNGILTDIFDRRVGFNTRIVHWDGLASGFNWNYDGAYRSTYPKISGLDWSAIYTSYWMKFYHYIDKGKLFTVRMKLKPGMISQFFMVVNNRENEGFSPKYSIKINGVYSYFGLQKFTSDGERAELEMFLRQ